MNRTLWVLALGVVALGCRSGSGDGTLLAVVHPGAGLRVSYFSLEVRAPGTSEVLASARLDDTGQASYRVAIQKQALPDDVELVARAFVSSAAAGGSPLVNGASAPVAARFKAGEVITLDVTVTGTDADSDGFVASSAAGPDCDDADPNVYPGAPDTCTTLKDSDCDGSAGCADTHCSAQPNCALPPSKLAFSQTPSDTEVDTCSALVLVQVRDASDQPVVLGQAMPVSVAADPATGFSFFLDAACSVPLAASLQIPRDQSQAGLYFKGSVPGAVTLTARASGLADATASLVLRSHAAAALRLDAAPTSLQAGACSPQITVTTVNGSGGTVAVVASTVVQLDVSPAGGLQFFADSACASSAITDVVISAGGSSASFYVKGLLAGANTLTARSAPLTDASKVVTVTAGAATLLKFLSSSQGLPINTCSPQILIEAEDTLGNPASLANAKVVDLAMTTAGTGVTFYADSNCTQSVVQVTLQPGVGPAAFFFRGTLSTPTGQSWAIRATATGLQQDTLPITIGVGLPELLAFVGSGQTVTVGACSAAVTIEVRDAAGTPVTPTGAGVSVAISGPNATFYSDASCTQPINSVTVVGSPRASFRFKSTTAGSLTLTATGNYAGGPVATQVETVNAGAAAALVITSSPQSLSVGACSAPVTVAARDTYGNPARITVALPLSLSVTPTASNLTFRASTDTNCSQAAIAGLNIAAGQSSAQFRFVGLTAGQSTIVVTAPPTLSASQVETLAVLPATTLAFLGSAQTVVAGACSADVQFQTQDAFGNRSPVATATTVNLSSNQPTTQLWTAGSSCGASQASVNLSAGQAEGAFAFTDNRAGSVTLTIAGSGLGAKSQVQTVGAAQPSKLAFTSLPQSLAQGTCSAPARVECQDTHGNPTASCSTVAINLSLTGTGFTFYSSPGCSPPAVTTVPVPTSTGSAVFHFTGTTTGAITVSAPSTSLASTGQTETIQAGPDHLTFTTTAQTLLAGACSGVVTVQARDASNAPFTVPGGGPALGVSLSAAPGTNFTFYSNSNCTGPISSVSIAPSSSSASFYFKGLTGGSTGSGAHVVTASAGAPIVDATQTQTILNTVRTGTCTIASNQATVACTIPAPALLDTTKTMLFFQATNTSDSRVTRTLVRCTLTSTSQINCARGGNSGEAVTIAWQTAAFPSGVTVQHLSNQPCTGTNGVVTINLPAPVSSLSDSFVLFSSQSADSLSNEIGPGELNVAYLTGLSTVEVKHTAGSCTNSGAYDLQVVEFTGASVTRGRGTTMSANVATADVTPALPAVDPTRTLLFYTWRMDQPGNNSDKCQRILRADMTGTTMHFSRGNGTTCALSQAIDEIAWERVELPAGNSVQTATLSMNAATLSTTATITAVDTTRSLVFSGGQSVNQTSDGEVGIDTSNGGDNDPVVGNGLARFGLTSPTTVQATRSAAKTGSAKFTAQVVQLSP